MGTLLLLKSRLTCRESRMSLPMDHLLEEQSLRDPQVLENPVTYHRALTARSVHFDPRLGVYLCGSYALMREILRRPDVFSSVGSHATGIHRSVMGALPPTRAGVIVRRSGNRSGMSSNDRPRLSARLR